MKALAEREVNAMQSAADESMNDMCEIGVWTPNGTDERGQPLGSFVYGAATRCGFNATGTKSVPGTKSVQDGSQTVVSDAILRLPVDVAVRNLDHVKITQRFGTVLAVQPEYRIIGEAREGVSAKVLFLSRPA